MINFLKGIVAGIGGVSPGLSGSVLLILPGMGVGALLFSKVIDFCLTHYEMPTRFCLLRPILPELPFVILLHLTMAVVAIPFILDFTVKKPD